MQLGRRLARHLLIFINLACMICATILMVKGGMMLWIAEVKQTIPIIALGFVIFVFAFLGFYGAIKEYKTLTLIYSILMLIIFTLECLLLFYTYYDQKIFETTSEEYFERAWNAQKDGDSGWINFIQEMFKCCGDKGVEDYKGRNIPSSCIQSKRPIKFIEQGCRSAMKSFTNNNSNTIQYILAAVSTLQIVIFSLGCYLADNGEPGDLELITFLHQ